MADTRMSPDQIAAVQRQIDARWNAARAFHNQEAARTRGVSLAGFEMEPFREPTQAEIDAEIQERLAAIAAFRASPRYRFLAALKQLSEIGYGAEAEDARACYARGFSNDREPVSAAEIGRALELLNPIAGQDAREARQALAELLMGQMKEAA